MCQTVGIIFDKIDLYYNFGNNFDANYYEIYERVKVLIIKNF